MTAGATARSQACDPPAVRSLAGAAIALALLLQALFAIPLALRMVADLSWQSDTVICAAATHDGASSNAPRHERNLPMHSHAQCMICQAHALPMTLLAVVVCVLMAGFGRAAPRHTAFAAPPWRRDRYRTYRSRAPPLAA